MVEKTQVQNQGISDKALDNLMPPTEIQGLELSLWKSPLYRLRLTVG
jgi:hypothetical protein